MRRCGPLLFCLALSSCLLARDIPYDPSSADLDGPVFIADEARLAALRARYQALDPDIVSAVTALGAAATAALTQGPWSVTDKTAVPPSGDKHDYMSIGIYWWPNPDTPNGLPYVLRDGEVNPEYLQYDFPRLDAMCAAAETLGLAYYYTGSAAYADRCALVLRAWFLDPATRMNPNLNFTQAVPGLSQANAFGVLEGEGFSRRVIDAIGLIGPSGALTAAEAAGLKAWFVEYLGWLRHSWLGREASIHTNNHGTFYLLQTLTLALYTGDQEAGHAAVRQAARLLDRQIRPDGRQPEELTRTKSFYYSEYNLAAWFALARAAGHLGYDLWTYEPRPGRSLGSALSYLAGFLPDGALWPYPCLQPIDMDVLYPCLHIASSAISPSYDGLIDDLPSGRAGHINDRINLQW